MLLAIWLWCRARASALGAALLSRVAPFADRLVPEWRRAARLWSVRLSAIGASLLALAIAAPDAVTGAWALLPPELLALLPRNVALLVPLALQLATGVARLIRQRGLRDGE